MDAYFDSQSDVLVRQDSRRCCDVAALKLILDWLKENHSRQLVVTGYCDRIEGTDSTLTDLDLRRAEAMKKYFTQHGVASQRIAAHGGGAFTNGENEMAWAVQRRAEPTEVPPK